MLYFDLQRTVHYPDGRLFLHPGIYYTEEDMAPNGLMINSTRIWKVDGDSGKITYNFTHSCEEVDMKEFAWIKLKAKLYATRLAG